MSEWITAREAAEILGVQKSAVPKMIRRGDLHPRARRRPSLSRAEVVDLAARRAREREERERRRLPRTAQPPDKEHTWLPLRPAAAVLGISPGTLSNRSYARERPRSGASAGEILPTQSEGFLHDAVSRDEVLEPALARAGAVEERAARRDVRTSGRPPDQEHDWPPSSAAAAVLGCTEIALKGRATRGQVPFTVHGGRRWFRLDLLELILRARAARRTTKR